MTCIGIDLGNLASKIGVARHRGVDILTNEVSNRATPSLVSFGVKQRAIGEAAKTQEISNFKNTVGSLKRLIGRSASDPEITDIEQKFVNAKLIDVNGTVGVKVKYIGEDATFTATQLLGMYLGKLRDIASVDTKQTVSDVVIAVPGWYTDVQRRALIDAARIANLNPLRIINDTTAVALGYGITKSDLPEPDQPPRHVVFVDIGHSNYSVAVVAYSKGQLTVKSTAYDRHLGGRDVDYELVHHFATEFKKKYKIDILSNAKATFRLATQVERLKKILSANSDGMLNVESIMNDIDVSSKFSRDQLEALIPHLSDRVIEPLQRAILDAGLTLDQIDAVELVGGSTRLPAFRQCIQSIFSNRQVSTTLNQDEAVTRGATFACAMLSPVFRVREFQFHDIMPYSVSVSWDPSQDPTGDPESSLEVFPRGNSIPSTKVLSFARNSPFDLDAHYSEARQLPGSINPFIAKVHVKNVDAAPVGPDGIRTVKVRTRLNPHGLISFEGVYAEEVLVEDDKDEKPMEVDGQPAVNGEAPKKKKRVVKKELPFIAGTTSLDKSVLDEWTEQEGKMHESDKLVTETENCKNALEEYVYDTRSKLDDRYAAYVRSEEKINLLAALQQAEDWLYTEEGEDAPKSQYVARLDTLHKLGDPVYSRWRESEERPRAASTLRETINQFLGQGQGTIDAERYSHIDEKDKQSVVEKAVLIQQWLDDQMARQGEKSKNADPILKADDIMKKRDELIYFATPLMSKPKPRPIPDGTASGTQTPKETGQQTPKGDETMEEKPQPPEMDVD